MGSGINSKKWGGIRDHSAGIWDQKPWDRDQHYCKGIRDPVFRHDNKDHKILKCALIEGACQHFPIMLYFLLKHFDPILGDPGADSGGEGKTKQAGKYGTKEKKRAARRAPRDNVLPDQFQTVAAVLASDWCQKICVFLDEYICLN